MPTEKEWKKQPGESRPVISMGNTYDPTLCNVGTKKETRNFIAVNLLSPPNGAMIWRAVFGMDSRLV